MFTKEKAYVSKDEKKVVTLVTHFAYLMCYNLLSLQAMKTKPVVCFEAFLTLAQELPLFRAEDEEQGRDSITKFH